MSWKPSKSKAREFAQKMHDIEDYCSANGIQASSSMDSFYFTHNGETYRVSNHTVRASNRGAFNEFGEQVREFYHTGHYDHEITASKTRLIEIHQDVISGCTLDKRGYVKH